MKKIIFTLLTTIYTVSFCFSQDIITKRTGENISAKVLEVTTTEIKYKAFSNPNGPIFSVLKTDLSMIQYEDGTKNIFPYEKKADTSSADLFTQGQMDASKYYKGYKGAGTGTLVASLVSPLIGLIPAIATSSTQPKDENLNYPHSDLMKKADYNNGYSQKSKKIKQGKVWKNWAIGFGVNLVAILLLTSGK